MNNSAQAMGRMGELWCEVPLTIIKPNEQPKTVSDPDQVGISVVVYIGTDKAQGSPP